MDARRTVAEDVLFEAWKRLHDGKYGGGIGAGPADLEELTDDVVAGLEEAKYQEVGDAQADTGP